VIDVISHDWAADVYTAIDADADVSASHPNYGMPKALADLWDGRLLFASTEVARTFGGLMEGALEAAEQATRSLLLGKPRLISRRATTRALGAPIEVVDGDRADSLSNKL
jgi:hypothetical protein